MRPESLVLLAAFLGAGVVLAGFADEARRGNEVAVRYAWMALVPGLCAALAAGAAWWARRRADRAPQALALANAALTAMLTHGTLTVTVPLQPGEPALARLWPALDIAGLFAVLFGTLLLAQRPMTRPRLVRAVQALAVLAALLSARLVAQAVRDPSVLQVVGAALGVGAMIACVRLVQRLVPRRARRP